METPCVYIFAEFSGNVRLNETIETYYDRYRASKRGGKADLCMELVRKVHGWNGRFLKRDEGSFQWMVVSDDEARAKVSQAFRNMYKKNNDTTARNTSDNEEQRSYDSKRPKLVISEDDFH